MKQAEEKYMERAVELARLSVQNGGGPFGAVIVQNGEIIAEASNSVTKDNDPTAHAEVNAVRKACAKLNTFDLSGCVIYSSCEPCPMCLSALYWAHIDRLYYGCDKHDAKNAGFDDSFIYEQIELKPQFRSLISKQFMQNEALAAFKMWEEKEDKTKY